MTAWPVGTPPDLLSRRESFAKREQEAGMRPGFFGAIGDSINSEWTGAWALRQLEGAGYPADPEFRGVFVDEPVFQQFTEGLEPEFWEMLEPAVSIPHAIKLRQNALSVQESRHRLATLGWKGTALNIAAAMLDPAEIAIAAGTAGLGGPAVLGSKLTRMQRFVRGGLVAGGSAGAIEGYLATQDPERDASDVMLASLAGFTLGGGLNAAFGGAAHRAVEQAVREVEHAEVVRGAMGAAGRWEFSPDMKAIVAQETITKDGQLYWKDAMDPALLRRRADQLIDHSGLDPVADADEIAELRALDPDDLLRRFTDQDPVENPYNSAPPRDPSLKPPTPDEIEARAGQLILETPDLLPEEALVAARKQIDAENAARGTPAPGADDLPEGHTRLWRGNRPTGDEGNPSYTTDRAGIAAPFAKAYGGPLTYVDVPTEDLPKYAAGPGSAPGAEYMLPPNVVARARTADVADTVPPTPPRPPKIATDHHGTNAGFSEASMRDARFGVLGRLNPKARLLNLAATLFAQDALLRRSGRGFVAQVDSASEWVRRRHRVTLADYYREFLPARAKWMRDNGYTLIRAGEGRRAFNNAVGLAISSEDEFARASGAVKAAAKAQRKHQAALLQTMQRHGVKGSLKVTPDDNYLTRVWLVHRLHEVIGRLGENGEKELFGFFQRAIQAANPDIDDALAGRIGRGMVRTIRDSEKYTDLDKARLFSGDSTDQIERIIREEGPELTSDQVSQMVYQLARPRADSNVPSRLKRRQMLDENYEDTIETAAGPVQVRMADLMDRDAERLFNLYSRQTLGASAERSVLENFARVAFPDPDERPNIESFDQLRTLVEKELYEIGAKTPTEMARLESLWRSVRGARQAGDLDPKGPVSKTLRVLRAFNFARLSGGFVLSQIPELGNLVGKGAFGAMLRQMPTLGQVFKRAKDGQLENPLLRQVESIWGIGTDHFINQITDRLDDAAAGSDLTAGRLEGMLQRANRAQSLITGFTGVDAALRRASAVAAIQYIADAAAKGKAAAKGTLSPKRLLELGLTEAQAKRVFDQLNDPSKTVTVTGPFGRSVKRLDLDKWDQDAAAQFITAVDKWANRAIQTNDIGSMSKWMHTDLGKVFLQFRSFVVNAWEKQTLHKVQMRDQAAFTEAAASMMIASLVYAAQQYAMSIGRADAEKFREERLNLPTIAAIGWSRGGWSSLLPAAIDNVSSMWGGPTLFQLGRYSGLDSAGLFQNPTTALADSVLRTGPAIGKAVREALGGEQDVFTQADAKAFTNLVPFRRMMGIQHVMDALTSHLPEREPRR